MIGISIQIPVERSMFTTTVSMPEGMASHLPMATAHTSEKISSPVHRHLKMMDMVFMCSILPDKYWSTAIK